MSGTIVQKTSAEWDWKLWFQWILANAVSETVGLGTTLLIGAFLLVNAEPTIGALTAAALGVLAGTVIEGSIVGTAQWLVLRHPLKRLRWHVWALATALGACVAWTLGMIPRTLVFTAPESGAAAPGEISDLMIYTMAAAMGIALGAILGGSQWLALRRHVPKAGWWIPANALAWMLGMVVVFLGTSFIPAEGITMPVALILLLFVVAAGAVVGAAHGLVLIWLLHLRRLGAMA